MARPDGKRLVRHQTYEEPLDLTGKDLVSLLDHPKGEIAAIVGGMVSKSEMSARKLPIAAVTSMTGEVADEVHEWPEAHLGLKFHHLVLHFRDHRLVGFRWSFQPPRAKSPRRFWNWLFQRHNP
jgi:hypothetical protein